MAMEDMTEIKQKIGSESFEEGRELEELLALASKVSQISDIDDLAAAFADWLAVCPESEGIVHVLYKHIARDL